MCVVQYCWCVAVLITGLRLSTVVMSQCAVENVDAPLEYVKCVNVSALPVSEMDYHWKRIFFYNDDNVVFTVPGKFEISA